MLLDPPSPLVQNGTAVFHVGNKMDFVYLFLFFSVRKYGNRPGNRRDLGQRKRYYEDCGLY
jgi:hypothetical protein